MSSVTDRIQSGALVAMTIGSTVRLAIVVSEAPDGRVTMMSAENPGIDVFVVKMRTLDGLLHVMVLA